MRMISQRANLPFSMNWIAIRQWFSQGLVLILLLLTLGVLVAVPFQAADWLNTPFLGAFVEHTMAFNGIGPSENKQEWSAYSQGLLLGYRLLEVEGYPVTSSRSLASQLQRFKPGDLIRLTVQTPSGEKKDHQVRLGIFSLTDRLSFLYFPYIIGLVYFFTAVWIYVIRRTQETSWAFAIFCAAVAVVLAGFFDLYTTHQFAHFWSAALALAGAAIFHLALLFPKPDRLVSRYPYLKYMGYATALPLILYTYTRLNDYRQPLAYIDAWRMEYLFSGLAISLALAILVWRRSRLSSPVEREQLRLVFIGALVSFTPLTIWFILTPFWKTNLPYSPYLLLSFVVFPLVLGYTIQRYRLLQTDLILSRILLYGLLALLVTLGYALLVTGLSVILGELLAPNAPFLGGIIIFFLALAIAPLRHSLETSINLVFFRGDQAHQNRLQTFGRELTNMVDMTSILNALQVYINETMQPQNLHIFLFDSLSEQFVASTGADGLPTSDLRFQLNGALAQTMHKEKAPIFITDAESLPSNLNPDKTRIQLLGAQLIIPLPGRQHLAGWLALGQRLSGEPYSSRDITFLEALGAQAALAIERAQVVTNAEKRVHEMNVLARIAQGVNITLSLNDILELIYAQTSQVIPADEFRLILMEAEIGQPVVIFYVTGDERQTHLENKPLPEGFPLEVEVTRHHRPIITDDYFKECRKRNLSAAQSKVYSFMSVPLNAGAETIGSLSLGKYDTSFFRYTNEQLKLLQAIADQVAGAIVKTRLLQETDLRARHLSTLNEVTRKLTSTLDLETLLLNILESASVLLNCEAGSLLLVDEQTDELVFRVTVGPVAGDLVNRRLPPGSGKVGEAVKTRAPVIVNDVHSSPGWFSKTDQQTGFVTRGLLVVPLMVKDNVIGVIEVVNKRDGEPFVKDEIHLLQAFASQAAVAIENTRLYTMTDKALAERVEELSVMQRIDRELNTSLDTRRAMQITLEWAMRQSGAAAGWVGVVHEGGIQVMSGQGYTTELDSYKQALVPLAEFNLQKVIETGVPQNSIYQDEDIKLLENARSRLVIPINREANTIGLIVLESVSTELVTEERINFLMRLGDHAAIAISNAQLYTAVNQANVAKSEFVSFVSHELKNPMTSIKGYTELLAAGAVGAVNEAQANFLSTIRSNIDRMNTLISDLNDLSKIEAGRLKLDFKAIKVSDAVDEVVRSTHRQIEDKNQQLVRNLPEDLPVVWADNVRLVQVLVNLVSNAHKYTPAGGQILVEAAACDNRWDSVGAPRVVHLWVKDNGIGISPDDQKKIFQKFFRSEDQKAREAPGTGLGLNITKSLIEMQGGRIWFESEFRKGTTFHITVPISG